MKISNFPLFIGIGTISIVGLSFIIEPAFEHFQLQTSCLCYRSYRRRASGHFVRRVKGRASRSVISFLFLIFFAIVVGMAVLASTRGNAADLSFGLWSVIKLFLVGIIASATMVIPGVSGSMMLLLLGYYNPIISSIKNFVTALVSFDVQGILQGCGVLVPAGLGIVVGIFAIAKLIEVIFKIPTQAYWAIIGLIVVLPLQCFCLWGISTVTIWSVGYIVTFVWDL